MEDIIAYSIIAIVPVVVIFGAVLLRRYFVRWKERKVIQLKQKWEQIEAEANQRQERERQRIREVEAIAKTYGAGGGVVGRQEYDLNTNTVRTSVHDPKTYTTKYVTTPAAQIAPGTVLPQTANNFGTDFVAGIALGSLADSLFSTQSYPRPSIDDKDGQKTSSSSFGSSDSSSSWGDSSSSDSGPSSDW